MLTIVLCYPPPIYLIFKGRKWWSKAVKNQQVSVSFQGWKIKRAIWFDLEPGALPSHPILATKSNLAIFSLIRLGWQHRKYWFRDWITSAPFRSTWNKRSKLLFEMKLFKLEIPSDSFSFAWKERKVFRFLSFKLSIKSFATPDKLLQLKAGCVVRVVERVTSVSEDAGSHPSWRAVIFFYSAFFYLYLSFIFATT